MKRVPGVALADILQMHRAFIFEVILGPDWAEDEKGRPKFLTDWGDRNKGPVADPYKGKKDQLRAAGIPEHLVEQKLREMIERRRAMYKAAGVKRRV